MIRAAKLTSKVSLGQIFYEMTVGKQNGKVNFLCRDKTKAKAAKKMKKWKEEKNKDKVKGLTKWQQLGRS